MGAYRWLSDNYEENDRIFLFGKSRLYQCISYYLRRSNRVFPWRLHCPYAGGYDRDSKISLVDPFIAPHNKYS